MLNGAVVAFSVLNLGGSTHRKGDELARRPLESRPTRLCLGEPRLREIGVNVVVVGTDSDRALRLIAGDCTAGVVNKLNIGFADLNGVPSEPLDFFEGDMSIFGSTFSESNSSNVSGENARLFDFVSSGCLPKDWALSSWIAIAKRDKHLSSIFKAIS